MLRSHRSEGGSIAVGPELELRIPIGAWIAIQLIVATPVYSTLLADVNGVNISAWQTIGTVPLGFRWVVRSVVAFNPSRWFQGLWGLQLADSLFTQIWAVGMPVARGSRLFTAQVHQTMDPGDLLQSFTKDSGWNIRVSGFQLTLPAT
jgi:hypothetical protein